jgi:hypothetical protein
MDPSWKPTIAQGMHECLVLPRKIARHRTARGRGQRIAAPRPGLNGATSTLFGAGLVRIERVDGEAVTGLDAYHDELRAVSRAQDLDAVFRGFEGVGGLAPEQRAVFRIDAIDIERSDHGGIAYPRGKVVEERGRIHNLRWMCKYKSGRFCRFIFVYGTRYW